jgi:choline dehydrogenase-like flavoprotein
MNPAGPNSAVADPIAEGLARGWRVLGGAHGPLPPTLECDVAIVGSGAGAGITAELLSAAGLKLVIVEEGPLKSSRDFRQLESEAYPTLYQESASRKTADKAINILQGRCVGGSTTVNWTSSFRTPSSTLAYWQQHFGLTEFTDDGLSPWFLRAEQRLNVGPWLTMPNQNNELLRKGALKLGIAAAAIQRNVKGCWNLGACGLGCPTNAKQSMLVTTLPTALNRGATLLVETRVNRLELQRGSVTALQCVAVSPNGTALGATTRVVAKHVVVATGYNEGSSTMAMSFQNIVQRARELGYKQIVWWTLRSDVDYVAHGSVGNHVTFAQSNQILRDLLATGAYPDVVLADWNAYTAHKQDWFVTDGVGEGLSMELRRRGFSVAIGVDTELRRDVWFEDRDFKVEC